MVSPMKPLNRDASEASHPNVQRVDALLQQALALHASDLHVGPDADGTLLARVRVDGCLRDLARGTADELPRVVARLKVLAGLSAFRTAEPQDGSLVVRAEGGREQHARLATLPVVGGEQAVLRFLDPPGMPRLLNELGLPDAARSEIERLLDEPSGALVVTGPCSSGKTTTLHAMARALLDRRGDWLHLVTVEDPVEQRLEGAVQVEADPARGMTFARALAAVLRQDPNVLLVGETRDPDTARMAIESAFTGHLVLTSLHVGSPGEVPRRLELLGVPPWQVSEAVRGVVSQRLLRRACGACAARGCAACAGSGHRGRIAVAEVARRSAGGAMTLVTPTLRESAARAVREGVTTEAEAARVLGA